MLLRAEVHITYKCDLNCHYCNRGCFSNIEFAPDMTIRQFEDFLEECKKAEIDLHDIVIIGGEPTLHPDCITFIALASQYGYNVLLFTNNYSQRAHEVFEHVSKHNLCSIATQSFKSCSQNHAKNDDDYVVFISPEDIGKQRAGVCPAELYCGFSVDSLGYTFCSLCGTISSVLYPEARTTNLADLKNVEYVLEQRKKLCKHCGTFLCRRIDTKPEELILFNGTLMTKTWYDGFLNLKNKN